MDNLTHTLFGATLARTSLSRAGRGTTAALLLASNAPDIDIVSAAHGTASYIRWHRGPTHGLLGVVGLGALTAAVVWACLRLIDRRRPEAERPTDAGSFGLLAAVSMLAIALHIVMDLPTSYGTRLLSPFDWHWYAFDWLPIIDVYLLAALVIGLIFGSVGGNGILKQTQYNVPPSSSVRAAVRRRMAAIVLAIMAANYGLRAVAHDQALVRAPQLFGPLLPGRCYSEEPLSQRALAIWPAHQGANAITREGGSVTEGAAAAARQGRGGRPCLVEIAAIPTFVSPFRWRLIAHLSNAYELHEIDLLDSRLGDDSGAADGLWRLTLRYPDQWTPATARAATGAVASTFLGFSRFPAARTYTDPAGATTVRWADMRFAGAFTSFEGRARRPNPFNIVVRLDPSGRMIDEHVGQ